MKPQVELLIENIRCFTNPGPVPLRKLTLLVGENSTGKSTFLALVRLAWDLSRWQFPINFNEEPFLLGNYREIANYRGSRWRADHFSIGYRVPILRQTRVSAPELPGDVEWRITFRETGSHPHARGWEMKAGSFSFHLDLDEKDAIASRTVTTPSGECEIPPSEMTGLPKTLSEQMSLQVALKSMIGYLQDRIPVLHSIQEKGAGFSKEARDSAIARVWGEPVPFLGKRPYAFAPVRTKPKRTYDPITEIRDPEGGHIPLVLARTSAENKTEWKKLKSALDEFGKASGLFENLEVRQLGDTEGDPFQIRIKFGKPAFNLMDVGYGVSQALPLVVDALRAEKGSTFLIQQPEVHLHPRAQAAFGSLLASLAVHQDKTFIVETHSDHIVDRVRMDVRDKKSIKPEDVVVLYFERKNGSTDVDIHPLFVDEEGNLLDAPDSYRQFFLQEERRFLGV